MTDDFQLNERAKAWIRGIRSQFEARDPDVIPTPAAPAIEVGQFKIL